MKMKRSISFVLAILMLVSALVFPVSATQSRTDYFSNNYTLTGNAADDMLAIAQAQLGRTASQMGYTEAWCANFVSDCAKLAGESSAIPANGYVPSLYNAILNAGGKVVTNRQKGDIIFYNCSAHDTDGDGFALMHVGIVLDSTYSIEGNYNNKVSKASSYNDGSHTTSSGTIKRIYVRPNYKGGTANSHKVDTNYGANFTAYLKNPNSQVTVYSSCGVAESGRYISGSDPVTIHEVYTDGCCKVSYTTDSGVTRTVYAKISDFRFDSGSDWNWKVDVWASENESPQLTTGTVGNPYYIWYKMYDANTGELFNLDREYTATISIKNPDGTTLYSYSYNNSSYNWIRVTPRYLGEYEMNITITGEVTANYSEYFTITSSGVVSLDKSSITLTIPDETTEQITATFSGNWPINAAFTATYDENIISCTRDGFNYTITAKAVGNTEFTVYAVDKNNNNTILATATCEIKVIKEFYRIRYDANGGTGGPSVFGMKFYGTDVTLSSSVPTRDGYEFLGWATSSTATTPQYQPGDTYSKNESVTLYAVWKAIPTTYTLTYNANNGGGAPSNTTGNGAVTISSTVPTRFGYTFLGWSTSSSATSASYEPGDSITLSSNKTLYAVWKSATSISKDTTYTPTINFSYQEYYYKFTPLLSGTYTIESTGSLDTKVYLYDSSGNLLSSNDDDGDGNNFRLSYDLPMGTATYYYKVCAYGSRTGSFEFTLTKESTPTYTVTYNANGGSVSPSSVSVESGKTTTLPTPTKSYKITYNPNGGSIATTSKTVNCTFKNWNTSSSGTGTSYNAGASYTVTSSKTLYAQWTNPTAGTLTTPTRSGYTFNGWYTASTGGTKVTSSSTISANTSLYAQWTKNDVSNYTFSIQTPSRTEIRCKDGIILHANVNGTLPDGAKIVWSTNNSNFKVNSIDNNSFQIVSNNNGYTVITASIVDADGNVLATDSVEMYSKAGFIDKLGGFFRSLFGATTIYES